MVYVRINVVWAFYLSPNDLPSIGNTIEIKSKIHFNYSNVHRKILSKLKGQLQQTQCGTSLCYGRKFTLRRCRVHFTYSPRSILITAILSPRFWLTWQRTYVLKTFPRVSSSYCVMGVWADLLNTYLSSQRFHTLHKCTCVPLVQVC